MEITICYPIQMFMRLCIETQTNLGNLCPETVYQERSISFFALQLATGIIIGSSFVYTACSSCNWKPYQTNSFQSNLGKRREFGSWMQYLACQIDM